MSQNRLITAVKQMGDNYQPSGNNVVAIDTLNNRIGINTSSPEYSLDVGYNSNNEGNNKIKIVNLLINGDTCDISSINNSYISIKNLNVDDISCNTINNNRLVFGTSLVINSDISVNGSIIVPSIESFITTTGHLQTGTSNSNVEIVTSDDRLKHNEEPIENALSVIEQLQPLIYQKTETFLPANYKGPLNQDYFIEAGLIAQHVATIPQLNFSVIPGDIVTPHKLNYNNIFVYGLASIKELNQKVDNNKNTLDISISRLNQTVIDNSNIVSNIENIINSRLDIVDTKVIDISDSLSRFVGLQDKIDKINNINNLDTYLEAITRQSQQIQRLTSQVEILTARIMTLENRNR